MDEERKEGDGEEWVHVDRNGFGLFSEFFLKKSHIGLSRYCTDVLQGGICSSRNVTLDFLDSELLPEWSNW